MNLDKYYRVLGISPGSASKAELKRLYRKLATEHHPDKGGDENRFKQISEAYEIVTGKRQPSRAEQREDAQREYEKSNPYSPPRQPRRAPRRPPPRKVEYEEDVFEYCIDCEGEGKFVEYCEKCSGTGNIVGPDDDYSDATRVTACDCNRGHKTIEYCKTCNGKGKIYNGKRKSYYWKY